MILPFSVSLNHQETHFPFKIWNGLFRYQICTISECLDYQSQHLNRFKTHWSEPTTTLFEDNIKIHTIRYDLTDRYKPGCKLHLFIYSRTKKAFRFAPVLACTSTQKIEIRYDDSTPHVFIDNRRLMCFEIKALAKNDGFLNEQEFFSYFSKDFLGKIVHWTSKKY
jgi:hypothetical protein